MKIDIIIPVLSKSDQLIAMTRQTIGSIMLNEAGKDLNFIFVESFKEPIFYQGKPFSYKEIWKDLLGDKLKVIQYDRDKFNFNHSLNLGLEAVRPDANYIVFSNNDIELKNNAITRCISGMEKTNHLVSSPKDLSIVEHQKEYHNISGLQLRKHFLGYFFVTDRKLWDMHIDDFNEGCDFWYSDNLFLNDLKHHGINSLLVAKGNIVHHISSTLRTYDKETQKEMTYGSHAKFKSLLENKQEHPIITKVLNTKSKPTVKDSPKVSTEMTHTDTTKQLVSALMISLTGENFVIPAIKSIYNHVERIVMVHGNCSWNGSVVENKVKLEVEKYFPNDPKFIHINLDLTNTQGNRSLVQYQAGKDIINTLGHWTMVVDCDEIWDKTNLDKLFKGIPPAQDFGFDMIRTSIKTFIKDVRFNVIEAGKPIVLLSPKVKCLGPRFSSNKYKSLIVDDIFFNHYSYVRNSDHEIFKKGWDSLTADGNNTNLAKEWSDKWMKEVYHKMETHKDVMRHIHPGYPKAWSNLSILDYLDVPQVVRDYFEENNLDTMSRKIVATPKKKRTYKKRNKK